MIILQVLVFSSAFFYVKEQDPTLVIMGIDSALSVNNIVNDLDFI